MRELSLFSGAGGGLLGTKLLGWRHCGYVEFNDYCQRVIRQRIKDGALDDAPIFGDIKTFISDGYAESYQGMVDVITAGFPCQPFSAIGKQKGRNDNRNMWPETIETIKTVQSEHVLLENTKGLATKGYILTIVTDLERAGYTVWPLLQLGADSCGASHKRQRIWIYARRKWERVLFADECKECECCGEPFCGKHQQHYWECSCPGPTEEYEYSDDGLFADTTSRRLERWRERIEGREAENRSIQALEQISVWPDVSDPRTHGSNDGVADRVERTRAIGNGQVPIVAATAWELLTEGL